MHQLVALLVLALAPDQDLNPLSAPAPVTVKQEAQVEPPAPVASPAPRPAPVRRNQSQLQSLLVGAQDKFLAPVPELLGSDKIKYGKLANYKLKQPEPLPENCYAAYYLWRVRFLQWEEGKPRLVPAEDLMVWPDQSQVFFGSGVEDVTAYVELTASYLFIDQQDKQIRTVVVEREVQVGQGSQPPTPPPPPPDPTPDPKPNPDPTPDPTPPPPPPPVIPDGKFGLTKAAVTWVGVVSLPEAQRKLDAAALADSFRRVAGRVDGGDTAARFATVDDMLAATKSANNAAAGERIQQWKPWFQNLDQRLKELIASKDLGRTVPLSVWKDTWLAIADGLDALAK